MKQESIELLKKQKNKASSVANEFIRIYDENKFNEALQFAIVELEKSDDDNHWKWQEMQGFCYWELEELNQADKIFEKLNEDKILWFFDNLVGKRKTLEILIILKTLDIRH